MAIMMDSSLLVVVTGGIAVDCTTSRYFQLCSSIWTSTCKWRANTPATIRINDEFDGDIGSYETTISLGGFVKVISDKMQARFRA